MYFILLFALSLHMEAFIVNVWTRELLFMLLQALGNYLGQFCSWGNYNTWGDGTSFI